MALEKRKGIDSIFPPVPECITPHIPHFGKDISRVCEAMSLPILPHQCIKQDGTPMALKGNSWDSTIDVPTYFISKWSLDHSGSVSEKLFDLDNILLRVVQGTDAADGRKTNGLFRYHSRESKYKFKPLNNVISQRYKRLDMFHFVSQDVIRNGKKTFDVDNNDIDFLFVFLHHHLKKCENIINHLNKPVFVCGEFIKSDIYFQNKNN